MTALFTCIDIMLRWSPPSRWTPSGSMLMNNAVKSSKEGYRMDRKKVNKIVGKTTRSLMMSVVVIIVSAPEEPHNFSLHGSHILIKIRKTLIDTMQLP